MIGGVAIIKQMRWKKRISVNFAVSVESVRRTDSLLARPNFSSSEYLYKVPIWKTQPAPCLWTIPLLVRYAVYWGITIFPFNCLLHSERTTLNKTALFFYTSKPPSVYPLSRHRQVGLYWYLADLILQLKSTADKNRARSTSTFRLTKPSHQRWS